MHRWKEERKVLYYIGLDVHKQKISYRVKDSSGKVFAGGWIPATRHDLDCWMRNLPQPWSAAMEATMFSGWIYDHLEPHAAELKVAHPLPTLLCNQVRTKTHLSAKCVRT
jgi:transposase